MARKARIKLYWRKSISTNVVFQELNYEICGQNAGTATGGLIEKKKIELGPNIEEYIIEMGSNTYAGIKLTASNGFLSSNIAQTGIAVGNLDKLLAPTNLTYQITDIIKTIEPVTNLAYMFLGIVGVNKVENSIPMFIATRRNPFNRTT